MAGVRAMAKLPPLCPTAVPVGYRHSLPAPHFRRSLTGCEMREAARNAKAHLLRATAVAEASSVEQYSGTAQSKFLDLQLDDRVVVNLSAIPPERGRSPSQQQVDASRGQKSHLMQGRLRESAVVEPTAVQQAAIPAILSGRNVAMQCYTGSGKVHDVMKSCLQVHMSGHVEIGAVAWCTRSCLHTQQSCLHTLA